MFGTTTQVCNVKDIACPKPGQRNRTMRSLGNRTDEKLRPGNKKARWNTILDIEH